MGTGVRSACSQWGCRPSDVNAAIELSKTLGRRLGTFTDNLLEVGYLGDVIANREEMVVYLSHRALEDMLLATLDDK